MPAGRFVEQFTFLRREQIDNGMGTVEEDFIEVFTTRAALSYREGNEAVIAARLTGKQPAFLTIRAHAKSKQVTTAWICRDVRRSTYDTATKKMSGHIYNIRAIAPDGSNRGLLRLSLERGGAAG